MISLGHPRHRLAHDRRDDGRTLPAQIERSVLGPRNAAMGVLASWLFGLLLGSPLVAVGLPLGALAIHRIARRRDRRARRAGLDVAVLDLVDGIGQSLRSGGTLAGSLHAVIVDAPDHLAHPDLRSALGPASRRVRSGSRLGPALARLELPTGATLHLVVTACTLLLDQGGPVVRPVERVADSIRAKIAAEQEARARTAQTSSSAALLAALPVLFALVVALIEPEARRFYLQTWAGCLCVVVGSGLGLAGWVWIDRMVER